MLTRTILLLVRLVLKLRYQVEVRGLDKLTSDNLPKAGGTLFLPNHPAHIDPVILISYLWPKTKLRPVPVEDVYYIPLVHKFFEKCVHALPIPDFSTGSNSYKVAKARQTFAGVSAGLEAGDSFALYPAGRLKRTARERIGGASALSEILKAAPDANIALVRTVGLWGSSFGWGVGEGVPTIPKGFARGFKTLLKNLIFFSPRRKIIIEVEPVSADFPRDVERGRLNAYLEEWYNRGFPEEGEPLQLVSLSRWRKKFPEPRKEAPVEKATLDKVPLEVRQEVIRQVARVAHRKPEEVAPEMHLFNDLGLDSLDIAELTAIVDREGNRPEELPLDMMTVAGLMTLAAGEHSGEVAFRRGHAKKVMERSFAPDPDRPAPAEPVGKTIQEAFLNVCDRMAHCEAATDATSGTITYRRMKERVILLAEQFRKDEETRVGVLLPASIAAEVVILALLTAGKVPVMINWTLGPRYLASMVETSGIRKVVTSEAFLEKLDTADLTPIHNLIVPLEAVRREFGVADLLRAKWLARRSRQQLAQRYQLDIRSSDDHAVILFTSGTESAPKGVPLSHGNVLSNLRSAGRCVDFTADDVFLSMLPPFHSFGYSVTGFFPLLGGVRVAFSPDPTNATRIVSEILLSKASILCAAPTFLAAILKRATPEQIRSLRLLICGAEKIPQQLLARIAAFDGPIVLIEGYGITECAPILTLNRPGEPVVGVGKPLPGVQLRIVDPESFQERPIGEAGLILARGPNVFRSYLGVDAKWPFVEIERELWYNTGDLGKVDQEGNLTLAGRLKRFVKIGGEMISLPAMESALADAFIGEEGEARLAVVPVGDEGQRPHLHLFATVAIDADLANAALKERGFSNLGRLSRCHQVSEMPLLGTGKIDYRTLAQQATAEKLPLC